MILKSFLLLIFALSALNATSIDKKIKKTHSKLSNYDLKYNNLSSKMKQIAYQIQKQKRVITHQDNLLKKLENDLAKKEQIFHNNKSSLSKLEQSKQLLLQDENKLEQKLLFSIARNLSLDMMLEDDRAHNAEALINAEVMKELQKQTKEEIRQLSDKLTIHHNEITQIENKCSILEKQINDIDAKKSEITSLKLKNIVALKKFNSEKRKYKRELHKLLKEKKAVQDLLSKLNIIKKESIEKEKQRRLEEQRRRQNKKLSNKNLPSVKKVGSSYQKAKTKRYRGRKTIAPLKLYKVVKHYGTYTDPIYKIKIFNESVLLKPLRGNNKVRNVLNGKVILAKHTALLKNLIIVEHKNGMHTIYAHLDKIAPGIKKGKRIRKGAIIGRVNNELMFEVTQKNYHINPLQLIR